MPRIHQRLNQIACAVESSCFNKTRSITGDRQIGCLRRRNQLAKVDRVLRAGPVVARQGLERHEMVESRDRDTLM